MELLVGMTIMTLLVLGSFFTLQPWMMQPRLMREASRLLLQLQDARTLAVIKRQDVWVCPTDGLRCINQPDWRKVGTFMGGKLHHLAVLPTSMHLYWHGRLHHRLAVVFLGRGGIDAQQGHFYWSAFERIFSKGVFVGQGARLSLQQLGRQDQRWLKEHAPMG
jgi:hypothetical protein